MGADRSVAAFLAQVHRQIVPVGPREVLAVERLLRAWGDSKGDARGAELRASLASLLAQNEEQWSQVAEFYDVFAAHQASAESLVPGGGERDTPGQVTQTGPIPPKPTPPQPAVRRILWLAAVALLVLSAALWDWNRRWRPPPVPQPPEVIDEVIGLEWVTFGPSAADLVEFALVPRQQESKEVSIGVRQRAPKENLAFLALLAAISWAILTSGLRLVHLGPAIRKRRRRENVERRSKTDKERARLEEQKAAEGRRLEVRYRVRLFLPVSRQAVLDSAEWLGRLLREERGVELDAEATVERTVAAAGQFSPVRAPRHSRQEVLLLVDTEIGSHPWLSAFRRLQEAWISQGITLRCYEFSMTPDSVNDAETRVPVAIEDLARRTEGLPLILFSRRLTTTVREGEPRWLGCLKAWPRRAWLDPDPRRPEEFEPLRRRVLFAFERKGLRRFHLSDEGIVLLARWLAGGGEGKTTALEEALPRLLEEAKAGARDPLAEALRKWALVAALVPDPTWDQLEAIRRHFPEIERDLPQPRYLQRLLEWIEREGGASAELEDGRGLALTEESQHKWQREQRRLEEKVPAERGFEERAQQLLLLQLGSTPPQDELDRQWWKFKRSRHLAFLEPQGALNRLSWIYDSAIAHEAVRWVDGELDRQAEEGTRRFSAATTAELRERSGRGVRIPLSAAFFGYPVVWGKSALLATGGALLLLVLLGFFSGPLAGLFEKEVLRQAWVVPVFDLVEQPTAGEPWSDSFLMGSEGGDSDERPIHLVKVTAFQMSTTEVTVAQYRACFTAGQCAEPQVGGSCNWGKADQEDHPINCVSWNDAKKYAQWVEARLPTEAEWEYAARSGGLERVYPWGDEPADCRRAIVSGSAEGSGCGQGGTWPVCSKTAGNTEQGLCDMAGNVWEWVEDDWDPDYRRAPEGGEARVGEPRASNRVIRGGSWGFVPRYARVANRSRDEPSWRSGSVGFRVARSLPSSF